MSLGSNHVAYVSESLFDIKLTSIKKHRKKIIHESSDEDLLVKSQKKID